MTRNEERWHGVKIFAAVIAIMLLFCAAIVLPIDEIQRANHLSSDSVALQWVRIIWTCAVYFIGYQLLRRRD